MNKLMVFVVFILFSCNKKKSLQGWYMVGDNSQDLIHITQNSDTLYIDSNGWTELAIVSGNNFKGEWKYQDGTNGIHEGKINGDKINIQLKNKKGKPLGRVIWNKIDFSVKQDLIYLTFDDGPLNGTLDVANVLDKQDVRATFFLVGIHAEQNKNNLNTFERLIESKHILANHSYSHANLKYTEFYSNPKGVLMDLDRNGKILEQHKVNSWFSKSNVYPEIIRFPGRNAWNINGFKSDNTDAIPSLSVLNSYKVIGWDTEWNQKNGKPLEPCYKIFQKINTVLENDEKQAFYKLAFFNSLYFFILSPINLGSRPTITYSLISLIFIPSKSSFNFST